MIKCKKVSFKVKSSWLEAEAQLVEQQATELEVKGSNKAATGTKCAARGLVTLPLSS